MQILPIDPSLQRVILQGNRSPEGLQLTLGQQIAATVLKVNEEGQLLLGFAGQKVWARSDLPLTEGQQLQLRVNQNGATVELQLLNTTAESSVENYELASLLQASSGKPGAAVGSPDPARLLEALQQLLRADNQLLTEPQSLQLRALLEPLTLESDAATLLPQIKNLIQNSGVFFEAKLRTILEAFDASPAAALQKVASDLKLLLAQLQQHPSSSVAPAAVGESTAPLAANPSLNLPAATSSDPELPSSAVSAKAPPENSLNLSSRQSGVPGRHAALRTLLELLKVSSDGTLQKLSTEVVTLLRTTDPEQVLTQATMSEVQRLLKQVARPGIPTEVSESEPQANHNQLATQIPRGQTADSLAGPVQELDQKMLQLLEAVRSMPEPESRKLLPELAALLTQTKEQALSALPETALAHNKATVLEQTALLSDQVLSRQTEAALEWLKNGAFQTELPLQFGAHSTQAKIRFFQETDKGSTGGSRRPLNINIYLDLPETGKLEAWARWEGSQIHATLYVRDAEARELFESQLLELSTNLREAGFSTAVLDVQIDPARLYKIQDGAEQALPREGSLLSLRV